MHTNVLQYKLHNEKRSMSKVDSIKEPHCNPGLLKAELCSIKIATRKLPFKGTQA